MAQSMTDDELKELIEAQVTSEYVFDGGFELIEGPEEDFDETYARYNELKSKLVITLSYED